MLAGALMGLAAVSIYTPNDLKPFANLHSLHTIGRHLSLQDETLQGGKFLQKSSWKIAKRSLIVF